MAVTTEDLHQFNEFAKVVIARVGSKVTLDEIWDQWRLENPTSDELRENVLAVNAAIRDMEQGDLGISATEHVQQLRTKFNLPSN